MQKKYFCRLMYGICAMVAVTSCGGEKAGGTAEFATVFAVAGASSGQLDADVATWVDADGGSANACVAGSFVSTVPDSVEYRITSTPYTTPDTGQSSTIAPSTLSISKVTMTLTPADTVSPVLPSRFQVQFPSSSAPTIAPNSTATVTVRVVDNDFKRFFLSELGAQSISCTNDVTYSYRAVLSFELLETSTNRVSTVTAPGFLLVKFADFVDV